MPDICTDYHAHDGNYNPGGNSCDYIVIHNTGNTASASQEASYAHNDQHNSSYHYVLDGGGTIYQILDDTDTAWSVGAWSGCTQYIGNRESISIEVCSDGVPFTDAEIDELTWLVGVLMDRHGIDADHVVRHRDCHSGHKDCPKAYIDDEAWEELKSIVTGGIDMAISDDDLDRIAAKVWVGYKADGNDQTPFDQIFSILPQRIWDGWHYDDQPTPFYQLIDHIDKTDKRIAELEAKLDKLIEGK